MTQLVWHQVLSMKQMLKQNLKYPVRTRYGYILDFENEDNVDLRLFSLFIDCFCGDTTVQVIIQYSKNPVYLPGIKQRSHKVIN